MHTTHPSLFGPALPYSQLASDKWVEEPATWLHLQ